MQSTMKIAVSMFLLSSVVASTYHSSAKLRRDGILNLYPFPRVGRASHRTWQVPLNDFYLDSEPVDKRQLYAFPRVGRSEMSLLRPEPLHPSQHQHISAQHTDNPGMWFGPRLGRSFKSEEDDIQTENNDHSDPEQLETINEEREKRQTKNN